VDQAQVAALMKKISENPNDVATLQQLGDLYFQTGDYETAGGWMEKILGVEPRNVTARLALGAALFNSGKAADAEKQWRQVLEIDAKNVEAHYDLGFMYLSQDPPDMAKVKAEWNEVIAIAPDSAIAKTVATHLKSLDASPAPSGAAGSPGASGAPSSAAPSTAAPSAAASPAAATPTPAGSPAP
jgi:cytochrome c-type biogenesis protein CcmH/NrfG